MHTLCIHAHTCIYLRRPVFTRVYNVDMYVSEYTDASVCVFMRTSAYICIFVYTRVLVRILVCACMYLCIRVCTCVLD